MTEYKEVHLNSNQDKFLNRSIDSDDSGDKLRKKIQKHKQFPTTSASQKIREFFKKQQFKEIINWAEKDPSIALQEYDEIKVNSYTLKIGQNALIKNANNPSEDYVGKIQKIITINESRHSKYICLVEVKWFYRKSEVIKCRPQAKIWISNNEVFSTNCSDLILASAILQPCSILTLEEYENAQSVDKSVFFTRLGWIPSKNRFEGYSKLITHCNCKQPLNPDLPYIQCDKCQKWYHMSCVGVKKTEYEQKDYICGCCR